MTVRMSGATIVATLPSLHPVPPAAEPESQLAAQSAVQPMAYPLVGRHIVVTRPAQQAQALTRAIQDAGGTAVLFPVLAIVELEDKRALIEIAGRLDQFDLAIFVSPNAVRHALEVIMALRPWPPGLFAATMGKSSERELARFGIDRVIAPQQRFDSEALLDLPQFQDVSGKRVVIFRGDGGRELLGQTLAERGATLEYVACYRRVQPELDPALLHDLWLRHELDAVTATSSEGLRNLVRMVSSSGDVAWLKETPVFVPHARIAAQANELGFCAVLLTAPGDAGLAAGLIEYFAGHANGC